MRVIQFNRQFFTDSYIFIGCIMALMVFIVIALLRTSLAGMLEKCGTNQFLDNFCGAVKAGHMQGGACQWLCDDDQGGKNRKSLTICSRANVHDMDDSVFMSSSSGPVFAMTKSYLGNLTRPYVLHTTSKPGGDTFNRASSKVMALFRQVLDEYLNTGTHDALLNSIKHPSQEPIPNEYVQSTVEILSNRRFILSLLFYGSGDRSIEPPGSATESVPAVSLEYTCSGVYQTFSLENNTTPLSDVLNRSASKWSLGPSIKTLHLYEIVLHLLDIEETTSEHQHEGTFLMCNLNPSQLLLHKDCVKPSQSEAFILAHPCTLKALDISKIIYSRDEVERRLSRKRCSTNKECGVHSCEGVCSNGSCQLSIHTVMSGILQICQLLHSIESQILEDANDDGIKGQFYNIIDRCLDLRFYPDTVISSVNHYALYNDVFQELRTFFIDLLDVKLFELKERVEAIAARKEANRHVAEQNKKLGKKPARR